MQIDSTRRDFLKGLATAAGGVVLLPIVTACEPDEDKGGKGGKGGTESKGAGDEAVSTPPKTAPEGWDPIAYNKKRGNAGAIPESYLKDINGPDGDKKHLGKHLPYIPTIDGAALPAGFVALMWGDPEKGHAKHPNAPKTDDNPEGHWYNWIRIRKATDEDAEELQSKYSNWPATGEGDKGRYIAAEGDDVTKDGGRNTVYLAALPKDVKKGDVVRIHAHCLTHGEYVDFITVG